MNLREKTVGKIGRGLYHLYSAQFTERVDIRFLNVRFSMEIIRQNTLCLIIEPRNGGNSH